MEQEEINKYLITLGLKGNTKYPPEEIKKAWRAKASEHHPDKGGESEKFIDCGHAYKMLTDPSYRRNQFKNKDKEIVLDVHITVPIYFEDAFFGKEVTITINQLEIGEDNKYVVKEHQELTVVHATIPEGCMSGYNHHSPGLGLRKKAEKGDLYIKFMPQPHASFRSNGMDIMSEAHVELATILKGGEVEVQTMHGLKTLKIPPGTSPGTQLTISKCGVFKRGKHVVTVQAIFPDKAKLKTEAWKGLDINWNEPEKTEEDAMDIMFERMTNVRFT